MVFAGGSMKHFDYESVKAEKVPAPAKGVKVRWLIDEKIGAPNFAMRRFTVEPGGYTPRHSHPWEHEVFILSGTGVVLGEGGKEPVKPGDVVFMPPDEEHQFRNTGAQEMAFLCLIPLQK
jgi:quercetin dioxygenase-like cupin family protein